MAKGRPLGAPKRTTRLPVRGATLEACENLLAAAKDERLAFAFHTEARDATPRRRWRRRRRLQDARFLALVRYMQAVTAAQDLANKKSRIGATTEETW